MATDYLEAAMDDVCAANGHGRLGRMGWVSIGNMRFLQFAVFLGNGVL